MSGNRADRGEGTDANALFAVLARPQSRFGLASAGIAAAIRKVMNMRLALPKTGGSRLDVTKGVSREGAQELGDGRGVF